MPPAPLISRTRSVFAPMMVSVAPTAPAPVPLPSTQPLVENSSEKDSASDLALLEQVISEAEQLVPQAVPTAMLKVVADAEAAQAAQAGVRSGGKETISAAVSTPDTAPAQATVESGQSVQYVEYEPNPELPPEVEGFLNHVEQHADQAPKEIVIADITQSLPTTHHFPSQPVVVIPITPDAEAAGAKQSPKFSIRWLVEWSHKIMKMFVGKVVYRTSEL